MTVVLSTGGFVRAAKGHEIDPRTLSYKTGDGFLAAARGRSTQQAVFLDSTGRAYSLPAHTLPSARGQGEPLSGRLDPPDGAKFAGVAIGEPAGSLAAGHRCRLRLHREARGPAHAAARRQGGAEASPTTRWCCRPVPVTTARSAVVALVNSEGRLLVFPASEVPEMPRGKGNKLFGIPTGKAADARRAAGGGGDAGAGPEAGRLVRRAQHDAELEGTGASIAASARSAARCCRATTARSIAWKCRLPEAAGRAWLPAQPGTVWDSRCDDHFLRRLDQEALQVLHAELPQHRHGVGVLDALGNGLDVRVRARRRSACAPSTAAARRRSGPASASRRS